MHPLPRVETSFNGGHMRSRFRSTLLTAIPSLLLVTAWLTADVALAAGQVPSGERVLGRTVIEPGYDDRTGNLIYVMTPEGAPFPSNANTHAISPLFLIVYPNSAADAVGTMNCAHEGGD